jgi:hypothetical protein
MGELMSTTSLLKQLNSNLPLKADFKSPQVLRQVRELADRILARGLSVADLEDLERVATSASIKPTVSTILQLAIKNAKSKAILLGAGELTVSLVMPAYGENVRLMPRGTGPGEDLNGEDFAVQKSLQLEWLFAGTTSSYLAFFVDDMSKEDPETSGAAISRVVREHSLPNIQVLFLRDGVDHEKLAGDLVASVLHGVNYPKNTRKAGAAYYGMAKAIQAYGQDDNHFVVLTDCDLSVDVAQIGNLIQPMLAGEAVVVAGSRRMQESILEIEPSRNVRANTARYFRQLLLPGLLPRDTQCGAKAYAAGALAKVLGSGMQVLDFSFDIELLTMFALQFGADRVVPVPVAWFDSSELTTTDSSVHWHIMRTQLAVAKANHTGSGPEFDRLVEVAESLAADEAAWLHLLEYLGAHPELAARLSTFDLSLLDELDSVSPAR